MSGQEQQIQEQPVELSKEEASQQIQPENFDDILRVTSNEGDPFAELMQQVEETPEGQHPIETDPVVEGVKPEPVESQGETAVDPQSRENPEQYQYWQSQADKRSKELTDVLGTFGVESVDELRTKYADINDLAPIARYIKSNPGVLDSVQNSLPAGETQGQTQQGDQETSVQQPVKPTKPNNYDALDAYSDPSSESFQYREELDSYRDDMITYSAHENEQLRGVMEQERAKVQQKESTAQLKSELVTRYNMPGEQVDQFVNYMSSPESMSLENLVTLWNAQQNGVQQKQPQAATAPPQAPGVDPKIGEMNRQREKLSIPQPVSVVPGSSDTADRSAEDSVMDNMIIDHKRQNPW
jgi:hypothetical protein